MHWKKSREQQKGLPVAGAKGSGSKMLGTKFIYRTLSIDMSQSFQTLFEDFRKFHLRYKEYLYININIKEGVNFLKFLHQRFYGALGDLRFDNFKWRLLVLKYSTCKL